MITHLLIALGISATSADATSIRHAGPDAPDTVTAIRITSMRTAPFDTVRAQALLARADEASYAGRVGEARRLYRTLIDAQREADQFAGVALWRLATTNLYADDKAGAASALDEMAASAARYGDPTSELRATFEAAVLYAHLKRQDVVQLRLERVKSLLQSPVITEAEKASVRSRIVDR